MSLYNLGARRGASDAQTSGDLWPLPVQPRYFGRVTIAGRFHVLRTSYTLQRFSVVLIDDSKKIKKCAHVAQTGQIALRGRQSPVSYRLLVQVENAVSVCSTVHSFLNLPNGRNVRDSRLNIDGPENCLTISFTLAVKPLPTCFSQIMRRGVDILDFIESARS